MGSSAVILILLASACIALWCFLRKQPLSLHPRRPKVVAQGSLLVVDTGNVVIDEPLPRACGLLDDPDKYIVVEFDPKEPPPPPCAGGEADEVDWELTFEHRHDHHLEPRDHADLLRLKIMWQVSSARTIVWRMLEPAGKER